MNKSPLLAFFLAFIPGFGHMYLGRRGRGVIYPLFFFGAIGAAFVTGIMFAYDFPLFFFLFIAAIVWGINMVDMVFTLLLKTQISGANHHQKVVADNEHSQEEQPVDQNERFFTILLSFIPGVGHFHMGLNQRGLTLVAGFFGLLTMIFFISITTNQGGFLIFLLALPVIWIYSLFDAIQQLNKKQAGQKLEDRTIMDDLDKFHQHGKKSKMLATILSIFPGAGHMYLGLQKRGLQLMAAFLLSIYVLDILHLSIFLFLIPIIWFFSFFDALQSVNKYDAGDLEDIPIINYLVNYQKWIGIALVALGVFYLFDSVLLPTLATRIQMLFGIDIWHFYYQYFQVTVVCLLLIGGGIKLMMGSKRKQKEDLE